VRSRIHDLEGEKGCKHVKCKIRLVKFIASQLSARRLGSIPIPPKNAIIWTSEKSHMEEKEGYRMRRKSIEE